jgi:hypothetical protein
MRRYWSSVIEPLLTAFGPRTVVEIGSHLGVNTANLLTYCHQAGATLHAIDPAPEYDVEEWTTLHAPHLVAHRATSLEALPALEGYEAVLIDGDHNWYTVFHELGLVEESCRVTGEPFPLVLLHDVGWPYGRRDLYYDPDAIPAPHRQPYAQGGLLPDRSELRPNAGLNQDFYHATHEHGPRNGVLTAVEDFIDQTAHDVDFFVLPPIHGLSILYGTARLGNPDFRSAIADVRLSERHQALTEMAESHRLDAELRLRAHVSEAQARTQMRQQKTEERAAAHTRALAAARNPGVVDQEACS